MRLDAQLEQERLRCLHLLDSPGGVSGAALEKPVEQGPADHGRDLLVEPLGVPRGEGRSVTLDCGRREPLHEDGAEKLERRAVSGGAGDHLHRHTEGAEGLRERLRTAARGERRRPQAAGGDGAEQRHVGEALGTHDRCELSLEGGGSRVEVGEDGAGLERRQGLRGRAGRRGGRVDAENDVAPRHCSRDVGVASYGACRLRVEPGDRHARLGKVGGEPAAGFAEPENGDLHGLTLRVCAGESALEALDPAAAVRAGDPAGVGGVTLRARVYREFAGAPARLCLAAAGRASDERGLVYRVDSCLHESRNALTGGDIPAEIYVPNVRSGD